MPAPNATNLERVGWGFLTITFRCWSIDLSLPVALTDLGRNAHRLPLVISHARDFDTLSSFTRWFLRFHIATLYALSRRAPCCRCLFWFPPLATFQTYRTKRP